MRRTVLKGTGFSLRTAGLELLDLLSTGFYTWRSFPLDFPEGRHILTVLELVLLTRLACIAAGEILLPLTPECWG